MAPSYFVKQDIAGVPPICPSQAEIVHLPSGFGVGCVTQCKPTFSSGYFVTRIADGATSSLEQPVMMRSAPACFSACIVYDDRPTKTAESRNNSLALDRMPAEYSRTRGQNFPGWRTDEIKNYYQTMNDAEQDDLKRNRDFEKMPCEPEGRQGQVQRDVKRILHEFKERQRRKRREFDRRLQKCDEQLERDRLQIERRWERRLQRETETRLHQREQQLEKSERQRRLRQDWIDQQNQWRREWQQIYENYQRRLRHVRDESDFEIRKVDARRRQRETMVRREQLRMEARKQRKQRQREKEQLRIETQLAKWRAERGPSNVSADHVEISPNEPSAGDKFDNQGTTFYSDPDYEIRSSGKSFEFDMSAKSMRDVVVTDVLCESTKSVSDEIIDLLSDSVATGNSDENLYGIMDELQKEILKASESNFESACDEENSSINPDNTQTNGTEVSVESLDGKGINTFSEACVNNESKIDNSKQDMSVGLSIFDRKAVETQFSASENLKTGVVIGERCVLRRVHPSSNDVSIETAARKNCRIYVDETIVEKSNQICENVTPRNIRKNEIEISYEEIVMSDEGTNSFTSEPRSNNKPKVDKSNQDISVTESDDRNVENYMSAIENQEIPYVTEREFEQRRELLTSEGDNETNDARLVYDTRAYQCGKPVNRSLDWKSKHNVENSLFHAIAPTQRDARERESRRKSENSPSDELALSREGLWRMFEMPYNQKRTICAIENVGFEMKRQLKFGVPCDKFDFAVISDFDVMVELSDDYYLSRDAWGIDRSRGNWLEKIDNG